MKNIYIPSTVEEYQTDTAKRAFPDERIGNNDFYRRMIGWVTDNRTPLLYEETHPDEYNNLSINFNWMMLKDYSDKPHLGRAETIMSLYALHEYCHMTNWLPTRLNEISASEYANQFTFSEYRASNESEILVHYRIPELRADVFPNNRIAVDLMKEREIPQQPSALLGKIRSILIEHDELDHLMGADDEVQGLVKHLKDFNGNRRWSTEHYAKIKELFSEPSLPLGDGLIDAEYEQVIESYEPNLTQEDYERNVMRNIRFAFGMCALGTPIFANFEEARIASKELEGRDALIF